MSLLTAHLLISCSCFLPTSKYFLDKINNFDYYIRIKRSWSSHKDLLYHRKENAVKISRKKYTCNRAISGFPSFADVRYLLAMYRLMKVDIIFLPQLLLCFCCPSLSLPYLWVSMASFLLSYLNFYLFFQWNFSSYFDSVKFPEFYAALPPPLLLFAPSIPLPHHNKKQIRNRKGGTFSVSRKQICHKH